MAGPGTLRVWLGLGEKLFDDTALASDGNWVDVTDDVRHVRWDTSTRRSQFDTFAAGTATIELDNKARLFDPGYTSGTYYGDISKPNVPVRITGEHSSTRYTLFFGAARTWTVDYTGKFDAITVVQCEDMLGVVSRYSLSAIAANYAGDTTGDRIGRVLDDIGFPSAWRSLNNGGATCTHAATTWGVNAYRHIVDVATADGGLVYCDRDGTITHDSRNAGGAITRQTTSQVTLSHDTSPTYSNARWSGVGEDYRDLIRISGASGAVQEIDNSETDAPPVVFQKLNTSIESDSAAASAAQFYADLYATDRMTPEMVEMRIATNGSDLRTALLPRRLRDRITVEFDPPGGGSDLSAECFIDGMSNTADPRSGDWVASWVLSSADQYDGLTGPPSSWLIIGDATRGKVGTGRIGY